MGIHYMARSLWSPDLRTHMRFFSRLFPQKNTIVSNVFVRFSIKISLELRGPNLLDYYIVPVQKLRSMNAGFAKISMEELKWPA